MVKITPAELPAGKSLYALLISAVTPRPIAFVSTQSAAGVTNLAPFSFFGMMCHDPPTLVREFKGRIAHSPPHVHFFPGVLHDTPFWGPA